METITKASSHDELDWAKPLAGAETPFVNLMTARSRRPRPRLPELAFTDFKAGDWLRSFFFATRKSSRVPSSLPPSGPLSGDERVGVAAVSRVRADVGQPGQPRTHVDVPFYNDRRVDVVDSIRGRLRITSARRLRAEFIRALFDARRRDLAA